MLNDDQIIGALRSKGLNITNTAKIIGVTKQAVSLIIKRKGTSHYIQKYIAELIGLPYSVVWGDK